MKPLNWHANMIVGIIVQVESPGDVYLIKIYLDKAIGHNNIVLFRF